MAEPSPLRHEAFGDLPKDVGPWLRRLVEDIAACFAVAPDGIYLHGSLSMGSFRLGSSDVDLLVAVQNRPEADDIGRLRSLLLGRSGQPYDVELSILSQAERFPWRHPAPFSWHYSEAWRDAMRSEQNGGPAAGMPPADPDLAAHLTMLRARGRALYGLPVALAFPEVPRRDFLDAVLAPDEESCLESLRADPVDGILNLLRLGLYAREGRLGSKLEGAGWALGLEAWGDSDAVRRALASYQAGRAGVWADAELRRLARTWTTAIGHWLGEGTHEDA